ncbi:MAG: glycosyltransferase [Cyanobacteria bacterium J06650_10]
MANRKTADKIAPFVRFVSSEIVLSTSSTFELQVSPNLAKQDVSLVIDIYRFDNPVHPEGHIGWWQFAVGKTIGETIEKMGQQVQVTLEMSSQQAANVYLSGVSTNDVSAGDMSAGDMSANGVPANESWVNQDLDQALDISDRNTEYGPLLINAVLRSNVTNAIIYLDKIPAFDTEQAVADLRAKLNRNWQEPALAYLSYVFPKSSTVRIVSRNLFLYDAVGNLCLDIYRMLRQNQVAVTLYAENIDFAVNDLVRKVDTLFEETAADDQILYFFSTYDPNLSKIKALTCDRKIAYFHGITEPRKLQTFDPELSVICAKGREQMTELRQFDILATNSNTNRHSLIDVFESEDEKRRQAKAALRKAATLRNNAILLENRPLENQLLENRLLENKADSLTSETALNSEASSSISETLNLKHETVTEIKQPIPHPIHVIPPKIIAAQAAQQALSIEHPPHHNTPKLLYVGRIKSHKKVEDVLELFAEYLTLDETADCWIVGEGADKAYWDYLMWVEQKKLKLPPGKVQWMGNVDSTQLRQLYASASVYISMSEDEGFCLPVLEAMLHGLPVFVYGLPAIREFIQDSGLYFDEKDFEHLAQTLYSVLSQPQRCQEISKRQHQYAIPLAEKMNGQAFLQLFQPAMPALSEPGISLRTSTV